MASTMFMRVDEVAEELGVSVPYAYKLILSGRIDRKFFHEKFYGTRGQSERSD